MSKRKSPPLNVPCELKSQFCDGKDVRKVQRCWRERDRMMYGSIHHWCKECRGMMHGGYRFV